ncbi:hypothetical protein ACA910_001800 [Epithemia clementina (nom. ined.)]
MYSSLAFIQFIFVGSAFQVQHPSLTTESLRRARSFGESNKLSSPGGSSSTLLSQSDDDGDQAATATLAFEEHKPDFIDLEKNKKYILGLLDNLSMALDKYILSGSKDSMTQAHNILAMIENQAQDQQLVQRAHRMLKRAGIVSPTNQNPVGPPSDTNRPTSGSTIIDGDAKRRKLEAEQRLQWEESRKKQDPESNPQESGAEGRSALSRRTAVNGKPDIFMDGVGNPSLEAISSASNDKVELQKSLSSTINGSRPNLSANTSTNQPNGRTIEEGAADKVAELVAQAGAATSFHGESLGIGGLDNVLAEVRRRVWTPLAAPPRLLQELGICPVRGLLLYGKPGNGKTLLARKLGQILSPLRPVTVVSGPEIMDKFVGSSEKNLREIFDNPPDIYDFVRLGEADGGAAMAQAALHVIVMDEFDAIARRRGGRGGTGGDQSDAGVARDSVVNQLLAKMDGVDPLCVPTLVIGLTNKRSLIDPALLRPGRFEVQVEVPPPRTIEQRMSILRVHTQQMHHANRLQLPTHSSKSQFTDNGDDDDDDDATTNDVPSSYEGLLRFLAEECDGFSGASLAGLARAAASRALERAVDILMDSANANRNSFVGGSDRLLRDCAVTLDDFEAAIQDIRSGMGESDHSADYAEENNNDASQEGDDGDDDSKEKGLDLSVEKHP